jgi:hemerythrin-like domain-containing protein
MGLTQVNPDTRARARLPKRFPEEAREMTDTPDPACDAARRVTARIKAEHLLLARIIAAMQAWVVQMREPAPGADLGLFMAMLCYVEEVPNRVHHPQEDGILFPAMAGVAGAPRTIAELEAEHAAGDAMLARVHRAFEAVGKGDPNALNRLSTAVDEFAEFYWAHMRKEEQVLLPLAAAGLTQPQWQSIERNFVVVNDPLFGSELSASYRLLFEHIAARLPEPFRGFVEAAAAR